MDIGLSKDPEIRKVQPCIVIPTFSQIDSKYCLRNVGKANIPPAEPYYQHPRDHHGSRTYYGRGSAERTDDRWNYPTDDGRAIRRSDSRSGSDSDHATGNKWKQDYYNAGRSGDYKTNQPRLAYYEDMC